MKKPLTVRKLKRIFKRLCDEGHGDKEVCYLYSENGRAVRDTITHCEVADEADGDEVHMFQQVRG